MTSNRDRSCGRRGSPRSRFRLARYSGQAVPEIRIEGMEHAEEFRERIRSLVHLPGSGGDGIRGAPCLVMAVSLIIAPKILDELVKIRQLLEMQRK